LLDLVLHDSCL